MAKRSELPYSLDAEKQILGAALSNSEFATTMLSNLGDRDYFYDERNQLIYDAIVSVKNEQSDINTVTVTSKLEDMKVLDKVGGVEYLSECCDGYVSLTQVTSFMHLVSKYATVRRMLLAIREIDNNYTNEKISIDNIDNYLNECESSFTRALEHRQISEFMKMDTIVAELQDKLNKMKESSGKAIQGISTGYAQLDELTDGFKKQEVTILAGRPGLGKTALSLNFAYNVAKLGHSVAYFSLEMGYQELCNRMTSARSLVDLNKIHRGQLSRGEDRVKISSAIKELAEANIYVDEPLDKSLSSVCNKARELANSLKDKPNPLGLIIIDYIGMMTLSTAKKNDSRADEIRIISGALKTLARELNLPILVLAQFNRDVEKRGGKPNIADLRDSGSLEQDADVILLLHRDDYQKDSKSDGSRKYGDKKPKDLSISQKFEALQESGKINAFAAGDDNKDKSAVSFVEVIVGKNRNGATGHAFLLFFKNIQRFDALPPDIEKQIKDYGNEFAD